MKRHIIFAVSTIMCIALSACSRTTYELPSDTSAIEEYIETTLVVIEESAAEETVTEKVEPEPLDRNDEIAARGYEFAESYAEMSWNYLHGAAWQNYIETEYFDFEDKSEGNYYEYEGIPFYKLLITDYTYDELIEYIKSFYTNEVYEEHTHFYGTFIVDKDNCIYVNGNEPTYIYTQRNERAKIIGYTENSDGSVTYQCYAKTLEPDYDTDNYFCFTINNEGQLCRNECFDSDLMLFSPIYYD